MTPRAPDQEDRAVKAVLVPRAGLAPNPPLVEAVTRVLVEEVIAPPKADPNLDREGVHRDILDAIEEITMMKMRREDSSWFKLLAALLLLFVKYICCL